VNVLRGLPGHPLHPPLTDATIGAYTVATGFAVLGARSLRAKLAELATAADPL
jgi:hypothetical protein